MSPARKRRVNLFKVIRWVILFGGIWCTVNSGLIYGQGTSSKEYIYLNGKVIAIVSDYGFSAEIPAPELSYALLYQGSQVEVRWCSNSYNAANFVIERMPGGSTVVAGGQGCISWHDTNVAYGTTYAYRVRAMDGSGNVGPYSSIDISTVKTYANDPLSAGVDLIRAVHFSEMRSVVESVRACAGLGEPAWTDSNLVGITIKAIHLVEIRNQLNEALDTLNVPRPDYTDASVVPGQTGIKAIHVQEIRNKAK